MNEKQALARLRKAFGSSKVFIRTYPNAAGPDERAKLDAERPALLAAKQAAEEAMKARRHELLQDPEYRRLVEASTAASKAFDANRSRSYGRRVHVCKPMGDLFVRQLCSGDSLAEVVEKAEAGKDLT